MSIISSVAADEMASRANRAGAGRDQTELFSK
jgi:hypothetical protein